MKITYFCPSCDDFFNQDHPCILSEKRCVHCKQLLGSGNPRNHLCFHQAEGKRNYDSHVEELLPEKTFQELCEEKAATTDLILHLKYIFKRNLASSEKECNKKTCGVCGKTFDSDDQLEDHLKRISPRLIFFCKLCVNFFKEAHSHGVLARGKGKGLIPYCYFCKKSVLSSARNHICFHNEHDGDDSDRDILFENDEGFVYLCDTCGKFVPVTMKDNHERQMHKKKDVEGMGLTLGGKTCSICGIYFVNIMEFKKHKRQIHNMILCHICGKNIPSHKIKPHLDSHSNAKNFKCTKCIKSFAMKQKLIRHSLVHSDEAKWKCPSCGKRFKIKYNLKVHMRIHTKIKPFECIICKKTFITKQGRDNHLRTHNVLDVH